MRELKTDFYPRPPRGGRLALSSLEVSAFSNFYPRPPRGGRQPEEKPVSVELTSISIHALREEGDSGGN